MSPRERFPLIPPHWWGVVASHPSRLLVLDYDGTLAPLRVNRIEARMSDDVRSTLERLIAAGRSRLAIVSGRPLNELLALTAGLDVHRVAEHGWDEVPPNGTPIRRPLAAAAERALELADDEARTRDWTSRLERKRCSRVLHTRGMEPNAAAALEREVGAVWRTLASQHALVVRGMSGGLELRVPGVDKGTAVAALIEGSPPETFVACLGDDDTDEDMFARVAPEGLAIRVGAEARGSRANARLESLEEVGSFLREWETVTSA